MDTIVLAPGPRMERIVAPIYDLVVGQPLGWVLVLSLVLLVLATVLVGTAWLVRRAADRRPRRRTFIPLSRQQVL